MLAESAQTELTGPSVRTPPHREEDKGTPHTHTHTHTLTHSHQLDTTHCGRVIQGHAPTLPLGAIRGFVGGLVEVMAAIAAVKDVTPQGRWISRVDQVD